MKKIINITLLELAKILKKREFFLGLIMVLIMGGGMAYGAYVFPDSFGVHNVIAFYGNFSSILIMFLAAKSLGEEFDLKTATFVFTSRSSRIQIITAKIVSIALANMLIGFCGGILYAFAWIICKQPWTVSVLLGILGKEILIYMIYGFAIGTTAMMITCVLNTTITPLYLSDCTVLGYAQRLTDDRRENNGTGKCFGLRGVLHSGSISDVSGLEHQKHCCIYRYRYYVFSCRDDHFPEKRSIENL